MALSGTLRHSKQLRCRTARGMSGCQLCCLWSCRRPAAAAGKDFPQLGIWVRLASLSHVTSQALSSRERWTRVQGIFQCSHHKQLARPINSRCQCFTYSGVSSEGAYQSIHRERETPRAQPPLDESLPDIRAGH